MPQNESSAAVYDEHLRWVDHSPAAAYAARHELDWRDEPKVEMHIQLEYDPEVGQPEFPAKCGFDVIAHWGGELVDDHPEGEHVYAVTVPLVVHDLWYWEFDEFCGWWIVD